VIGRERGNQQKRRGRGKDSQIAKGHNGIASIDWKRGEQRTVHKEFIRIDVNIGKEVKREGAVGLWAGKRDGRELAESAGCPEELSKEECLS